MVLYSIQYFVLETFNPKAKGLNITNHWLIVDGLWGHWVL